MVGGSLEDGRRWKWMGVEMSGGVGAASGGEPWVGLWGFVGR